LISAILNNLIAGLVYGGIFVLWILKCAYNVKAIDRNPPPGKQEATISLYFDAIAIVLILWGAYGIQDIFVQDLGLCFLGIAYGFLYISGYLGYGSKKKAMPA
jgi:hypothetical protein